VTASPLPFDASKPHVARVYDYLLGGKDNFAADRAVGDRMLTSIPAVQLGVRAQRDVLGRVVRYLVGEVGLRQLLDIGSGLPTADNVHEIAQRIDPATRVVYLDNDPIVLSHSEALLVDDKSTFVVEGDLRDPVGILAHPDMRKHLDWEQPIGLLMCGILEVAADPASVPRARSFLRRIVTEWQLAAISDETCTLPDGGRAVRHSKDPNGPTLIFTPAEWQAFIAGVKVGEFD
jgi:S-adenosyl methyltransferase/Domain of unknown function (DUF397)